MKGDEGVVLYKNVEIEWIKGKKATMTVYKSSDGVEGEVEGEKEIVEENILLSDYTSSDELHALFERLGFEKKDVEAADDNTTTTAAKATTEKDRKLQEQRRIDEEEIRRKKIELNNRRIEMMKKEQRMMKDRAGDNDLQKLNKMMDESRINEKKLYKLMKEVEKGQRDPDDEQIIQLRRQIEKTKVMISKRTMNADAEKVRLEQMKRMKEQRAGARNDL